MRNIWHLGIIRRIKMNAQKLIYDRFIAPLKKPRASYIGIEIEMPVVNLSGEKTDKSVSTAANNIVAFFMRWRSRASRLRRWLRFASGSESISRNLGAFAKRAPKVQFRGFKNTTLGLQKGNSGSP